MSSRIESESRNTELVIPREQNIQRVGELAVEIVKDYGVGADLLLVVMLNGGMHFAVDLHRELYNRGIDATIGCVLTSSYGDGQVSNREPEFINLLKPGSAAGHDLLLVEDMAETGLSINRAKKCLLELEPNSLKIAVLTSKSNY